MKILKKQTMALQEGLTVSMCSNGEYGWIKFKGVDPEGRPVELLFSTHDTLPIIAKMVRQLEEATT
ncbi:hypothetical protein LCGC14_0295450 [marine sediment metagenome]|uniref:Uncharacterized protein n=1 Tax=marine sediment metagenome TaxID=412755 RepID=A0A0F9U976_9ZZZZ